MKPKPSKLKVYGGSCCYHMGKQYYGFVATTSQVEAAKLFHVSLYYFRQYCGENFNARNSIIALNEPGVIFVEMERYAEYPEIRRWEDVKNAKR